MTCSSLVLLSLFFFFSSRRRHTRLQGDWSSDVCSSDLGTMSAGAFAGMNALQKLVNPKAAEAIEVQKDLKAGYYNDEEEEGEGDEPEIGRASCRERV